MNNLLKGLVGKVCLVNLDDIIIIIGRMLTEHLKNLQEVMK